MTEPDGGCLSDDIVTDLALGYLSGRERVAALAHAAGCVRCRGELRSLVETGEALLLAGPLIDPPAGFETAVLSDIQPRSGRVPRRVGALAVAAVVAALVAFAALTMIDPGGDPVAEATMITPEGRDVGSVWHNAGDDQPWVFLSVPRWTLWETSGPHEYRLEARLGDGTTVDLGRIDFAVDDGSYATTLGRDVGPIRSLSVTDETGRVWCRGEF